MEQTYRYPAYSSAAAWCSIAEPEIYSTARILMPLGRLAVRVSKIAGPGDLCRVGVRCAAGKHKKNGGLSSLQMASTAGLAPAHQEVFADMSNVTKYPKVWDVKLDPGTVDTLLRQS